MKIGPATELDKRNKNIMLENFDFITTFFKFMSNLEQAGFHKHNL